MKHNILVVQQNNFGGEQIAVKRLFDAYSKRAPNSRCTYKLIKPFKELKSSFSFIIRIVKYFKWSRIELAKLLKDNVYDFLVTSDYLLALAFYSLHRKNIKIVFIIHGLRSVIFKKITDINYRQIIIKFLERTSWWLSDAIIVPTDQARQFLGLRNAFVLQNIVPDKYFVKNNQSTHSANFIILYSGRLVKSKGLENLIKALDNIKTKVPRIKLHIAYPTDGTDPQIYSDLRRLIKNADLYKFVRFISDPSEDELIGLYRDSNVLVLASDLEFAPLSAVEAMAAGTPVIGTAVGNIQNLLNKVDRNLILKNNSPDEISQKLVMFYKYRPSKKETLIKKSKIVAKSYEEANILKSFVSILNNI